MTIMEMLRKGEWEEMALVGLRRFGVPVHPDRLRATAMESVMAWIGRGGKETDIGSRYQNQWTQSYQEHWLKARMQEAGAFSYVGCGLGTTEGFSSCTLHVGFLSIMETPEELARLKGNPEQFQKDRIARSKLHSYLQTQIARPIDRVAARVAPENRQSILRRGAG